METFLTVILVLLLVMLALALALAVFEEIFNRRQKAERESRMADGMLRVIELRDGETIEEIKSTAIKSAASEIAAAAEPTVTEKIVYIPVAGIASKSYTEKYSELDTDSKARLDDFTAHATFQPFMKVIDSKDKVTFKRKTKKVGVATIKRGVPVISFMQSNPEFERFLKEKKIKSVKLRPIVIKLNTDENAEIAKNLVDITCSMLARGVATRELKVKNNNSDVE